MPWEAKTVEMTREEFVNEVIAHHKSKTKLCWEYGISRPTGDKWLKRYRDGEGFKDRSHRPFKTPPNKTAMEMEQVIIERRQQEPGIGAVKLKRILENEANKGYPATALSITSSNETISSEQKTALRQNRLFVLNMNIPIRCGRPTSKDIIR